MKKLMDVLPLLLVVVLLFGTACQSNKKKDAESCEYENTFIKFADDQYVWTEDGKAEPGALNWRKADTGAGYEAYLMDVFYETNPAYPVSIKGDTLILQDCSETGYKYTLVRK